MKKKILIFGESIIDKHEDYDVIAGAPLHVAVNLKKKSLEPYLLTAVGSDKNGDKIFNFLKKNKLKLNYIEKKLNLKTGEAIVSKKQNGNSFKLANYCAWDEIETIPSFTPYLLYTGSIVARSSKNLNTLKEILKKKINYIFFDLNLRMPYINWNFISFLIKVKITHLKLTENEYIYLRKKSNNLFTIKNLFKINKKLEFVALTKGGRGSEIFLRNNIILKHSDTKIKKIFNSVGAGDVFSAILIKGILKRENLIDSYFEAINAAGKSILKKTSY